MRVILAGGGSAGHTSPLLATAEALRRRHSDLHIVCVGTARGLETTLIPAAGYPLELVPPVPFPRRPSIDLLRLPARVVSATAVARSVLRRLEPAVVVGFGGYVCVPVYLACRRDHMPLVVHEGNALPGIANRLGARWADVVATSFPDTPLPHARFVGLPIRRSISTLDRTELRPLARAHFGLRQELPTLLVTGGSQGARRLNEAVSGAAAELISAGIQMLHVSGLKNTVTPPRLGTDSPPYVVVPFVERMELAYAASDLLIGRSGANTVSEAAALGLPAIFVPLPIGNGEQARNAAAVVAAGGAVMVSDSQFTSTWVQEHVPALMGDGQGLTKMGGAAAELIRRDADEALADLILQAAR